MWPCETVSPWANSGAGCRTGPQLGHLGLDHSNALCTPFSAPPTCPPETPSHSLRVHTQVAAFGLYSAAQEERACLGSLFLATPWDLTPQLSKRGWSSPPPLSAVTPPPISQTLSCLTHFTHSPQPPIDALHYHLPQGSSEQFVFTLPPRAGHGWLAFG